MPTHARRILTLNSGSSSLRLGLFELGTREALIFSVGVERIGKAAGRLLYTDGGGADGEDRRRFADHREALHAALDRLEKQGFGGDLDGASHRIVHGGSRYCAPQRVRPDLMVGLRELIPLDPDHLPQALVEIEVTRKRYPDLSQVACFDTAFHRTMPRVARLYALPARFFDRGVQRYGFHGLSYESIVSDLRVLEGEKAGGRVVVAHLGHGASMAAIRDGRSVDTSMGFTPASGLPMGRRSGDVGPGVVLHLLTQAKMSAGEVRHLINHGAGLRGVSGMSGDMQDLLAAERDHPHAADAVALFCHRAKKYLGSYIAVLGGLDVLVFTAGIGEHAPAIRERICTGLEPFGIHIDPERNRRNEAVISGDDSAVRVRVMKTNENLMLARHAAGVLRDDPGPHGRRRDAPVGEESRA